MTLPKGVLTQNSNMESESSSQAEESQKIEFQFEEPENVARNPIPKNITYKPHITEFLFEIFRHVPFVNIIALFVFYMVKGESRRSDPLLLVEGLTMLLIDVFIVVLFFKFTNMTYEQLAHLFTILQ